MLQCSRNATLVPLAHYLPAARELPGTPLRANHVPGRESSIALFISTQQKHTPINVVRPQKTPSSVATLPPFFKSDIIQ